MKKLGVFFLAIAVALIGHAARVDTVMVYASKMKNEVKVVIVTPTLKKFKRVPVLYLLHGYGDDAKGWISNVDLSQLADRYEIMFVCPDGRKSWYWDSPLDPSSQYETFISKELISYVDSRYPSASNRGGRAITGLSMGGHGALWNAFRHTDVFGAAGSMSGGVDIRPFPHNWEMKKQLGERDANLQRWNNYTVINQLDNLKDGQLAIAFECGYDDFFFEVNNNLHQALLDRKIGHDYTVRPGKHHWPYWRNAIHYQVLFFSHYFERALKK